MNIWLLLFSERGTFTLKLPMQVSMGGESIRVENENRSSEWTYSWNDNVSKIFRELLL